VADDDMSERAPAEVGETARTDRQELGRRAVSGALWNYGSFAYTKIATLVVTIVLARFLTPAEFGVVALALVIVNYLDVVNAFGISSAVIYEDEDDDRAMSQAFWLSQGTGFLAFLVTAATAPLTAHVFGMPELAPVQAVLGLGFVLSSLGSVHDARLRRRLQWRRRMPADVARSTTKVVVAVLLAVAGLGAWALVWSQLAALLVFSIGVMLLLRWRPQLVWDRAIVRRQLSYGGQVTATTLAANAVRDLDYLLIGAVLTPAALGYYTMGFKLPDLAIMGVTYAISQTVFPVLSRMRDDREALAAAVVRVQRVLAVATLPIATVLWVASDQLVRVLYGTQWGPTAEVAPWIAAYSAMHAFAFVGGDAFKAIGRVGVLTTVILIRLPITFAVLWVVVPHGIVAVAMAQAALMLVNLLVQLVLTRRFIGPSLLRMLATLVPAALGSAVLAVVFLLVESLGWGPLATLLVGVGAGLAAYAAVVGRLEHRALLELRALVRPGRQP
jgi:PST family polysaccharide transporter